MSRQIITTTGPEAAERSQEALSDCGRFELPDASRRITSEWGQCPRPGDPA